MANNAYVIRHFGNRYSDRVFATSHSAIAFVQNVSASADFAYFSGECTFLYEDEQHSDQDADGSRATAVIAPLDNDTLTDRMIRNLRDAAGSAGDMEQVEMCDKALDCVESARLECIAILKDGARE